MRHYALNIWQNAEFGEGEAAWASLVPNFMSGIVRGYRLAIPALRLTLVLDASQQFASCALYIGQGTHIALLGLVRIHLGDIVLFADKSPQASQR